MARQAPFGHFRAGITNGLMYAIGIAPMIDEVRTAWIQEVSSTGRSIMLFSYRQIRFRPDRFAM